MKELTIEELNKTITAAMDSLDLIKTINDIEKIIEKHQGKWKFIISVMQ